MKTLNTLFVTISAIALIGLSSSCESVSNPDPIPVVDTTKTATVSGNVYANLDATNDTTGVREDDYEAAPSGQEIKVVVSAQDFNPDAGADDNFSYSTTVDGSGSYSIDVPAKDAPIQAEVYMNSFKASQTTGSGSTEQTYVSENSPNPYVIQIQADLNTFQDLYYEVQ